jgi:asparagine synthase (glutamine-hydrolysing)
MDSAIESGERIDENKGTYNLYLGHRRLSILDLSCAGHQPMHHESGTWIVFNGEIYNFIELRDELKKEGYRFATGTDTEVILATYDKWGERCVSRFNGDWAFCIFDPYRQRLFLSRDRYGIKPLYFLKMDGCFAFASELKSLLTLPFVKPSLNLQRASDFLALFCLDHTEETFFEGILQLKPGHNLTIDLRNRATRSYPYYAVSFPTELGKYDHRTALKHAENLRDLLFDSVRLRLRADVPIGTCLSGGLDSSTVVAIVAKLLGSDTQSNGQKTFTASFPGYSIDESRFARLALEKTGAEGLFIYPSKENCLSDLDAMLTFQDEPFGGSAIYAQWEVMREASRHVKVVLDGQGGDEVFAGYRDYRLSFLANLVSQKRFLAVLSEVWCGATNDFKEAAKEITLMPFFVFGNSWKWRLYQLRYAHLIQSTKQELGLQPETGQAHMARKFTSNANELLYEYLATYSLPHLLKYEDRNSMAHSIEARVPFTDHRIVDYVFSIPATYKIHRGWSKWLLRLAVKDLLPPEITWRKDKLGFATPPWISRTDVWRRWIQLKFPEIRATTERVPIAAA